MMMKSESQLPQGDNPKECPKHIVFQWDTYLDTFHYRIWTGAVNDEGANGTICEFREALHQCRYVHSDDICACDRVLEAQTGKGNQSSLDMRLMVGLGTYVWYRLYTVTPANPNDQLHTISGVLVPLQSMLGGVRRNGEKSHHDTLFRKVVASASVLSLGFDCSTGERLVSDSDVLPQWLPENARLKDIVNLLREPLPYAESRNREISRFIAENVTAYRDIPKPFFRDCRLPDLTRKTEDIRWYRIYHAFIRETPTSPAFFYLTVIDISEEKDQQRVKEDAALDRATGMLKRCALEDQVTQWLERIRREAASAHVCSVVIDIEHAVEMATRLGRDSILARVLALSKTIKAFIHPHEVCGRYGFAGFAIVMTGSTAEMIQERLKMLRMVFHSLNTEWEDLQVRFGSSLGLASQIDQGDLFLEMANQALRNEASGTMYGISQLAANAQMPPASLASEASLVRDGQETLAPKNKPHIFLRTFGHFDVFVDGEAILFHHSKAKELLALLVDRRGGFVGATEAISCLWEDEPANSTTLSRCRKAAMHLRETLCANGIEYLMETVSGKRRIRVGSCECDYYQYLQHTADGAYKTPDSYLSEYSWAENTVAHEP